jgi:hypothetical protein
MVAIDKLRRDLDEWQRHCPPAPTTKDFDNLRSRFLRAMGNLPTGTANAIFTSFLARFGSRQADGTAALDWLSGVGSLFLMDFNGQNFSSDEWSEIRDIATHDSGDIDLELLTYILAQVMEHGGL